MKLFLMLILSLILTNCANKPKTVLICGDHVCVNKAEAEQFFKDNLSIEVKIIDKKKEDKINLVELNLRETPEGKKVNIVSKKKPNNQLKSLSKKEIFEIKEKIKKSKNKEKKVAKKLEKKKIKKEIEKKNNTPYKDIQKNLSKKDIVDICTIVEKCSIDEISKYLLEQGRKKDYPDITKRQ